MLACCAVCTVCSLKGITIAELHGTSGDIYSRCNMQGIAGRLCCMCSTAVTSYSHCYAPSLPMTDVTSRSRYRYTSVMHQRLMHTLAQMLTCGSAITSLDVGLMTTPLLKHRYVKVNSQPHFARPGPCMQHKSNAAQLKCSSTIRWATTKEGYIHL